MSSDDDYSQSSLSVFAMSEKQQQRENLPRDAKDRCRAIDSETGNICGETEGLRILDQFRKIYEARMEKVEEDEAADGDTDFLPIKFNIMKEWIKDLGEQNSMLVRTVEDLEQAACYRVKVLEEKLKETAGIVSEKMAKLKKPEEDTVNTLSKRIYQLEADEGALQQKIGWLESDIRGLLELIRRGRCENCWSIQGIDFFEIHPDDIPAPTDCTCTEDAGDNESVAYLKRRLEVLGENEKKSRKHQAELKEKIAELDSKLTSREETIKKYISRLESLRDNLKKRSTRRNQTSVPSSRAGGSDFESDIASMMDIVESAILDKIEKEERPEKAIGMEIKDDSEEVKELRAKLEDKSLEIERLSRRLSCVEKESLETREALTNEVAEKHDMGMSLRAEVAALEEQCRRGNMLVQFKEDIIKGMRRELKQRPSSKGPGSSGRKVRINAEVPCGDQADECSSQVPDRYEPNLVSDLNNAKTFRQRENEDLLNARNEFQEILEEMHAKERENYERDIASAHIKLKDMGTLLNNYKSEVIDRTETSTEAKYSDNEIIIHKLAKSIANLSKVCVENKNGIILLERAIEKCEKDDRVSEHEAQVTYEFNERWKWDSFNRQFRAMEEFRVCTVEAQAATENLREEMEVVVENLKTRHERYLDLWNVVKLMRCLLTRTKEKVSDVISRFEKQENEKISCNEKVASGEMKLKDIKNEINKSRSERSRDVVDFAVERCIPGMTVQHNTGEVIDRVVDVVEQVVCHLRLLRSQDQCGASWLGELKGQLINMEESLDKVQRETDQLVDTEVAQKVVTDKILRMDKFERELDYAHTKMQDTLEAIVQTKQRMIDGGVCNLCSCPPDDTMPSSNAISRHEDDNKSDSPDVEQLKNILRSKDKLLEDKDEIIRIQKDSITVTHVELNDLHQKMQTKIDAQNIAISQHVEEKRLLLEQSKLQNQTIGHLREAVVEAKRCMANHQHPQQKSTVDVTVNEVWNPIKPTIFNSSDVHDV